MAEPRFIYHHHERDDYDQCHVFSTNSMTAREVMVWCAQQFGKQHRDARWTSSHNGDRYWIRKEADALAFRLRWC